MIHTWPTRTTENVGGGNATQYRSDYRSKCVCKGLKLDCQWRNTWFPQNTSNVCVAVTWHTFVQGRIVCVRWERREKLWLGCVKGALLTEADQDGHNRTWCMTFGDVGSKALIHSSTCLLRAEAEAQYHLMYMYRSDWLSFAVSKNEIEGPRAGARVLKLNHWKMLEKWVWTSWMMSAEHWG